MYKFKKNYMEVLIPCKIQSTGFAFLLYAYMYNTCNPSIINI